LNAKEELKAIIKKYVGESLLPWEEHYLDYHAMRYLDTLAVLGPGQGLRLLDVGAFPGHLTVAAHHLGYQVDGISGRAESGPSLQMIVDRLSRHHISLTLVDVESEPFPFPNESFDMVLASEIIEHLHFNPYRLLRESFRVLKPGGRILITTPNINRLENIIRMVSDRTIHSEISGRFDESFSSILSARHIREYSASDLAYLLQAQNKEMYRFGNVKVHYSKCLDPAFSRPLLAGLIDRFWPRFRSTLLIEAIKPKGIRLINPLEVEPTTGFYPIEEHGVNMDGIARMLTTPFRWSEETAQMNLPASEATYQIFYLNLVYLVPDSLPPGRWTVSLKGRAITYFTLPPDRMFTTVRIVLQVEDADQGTFYLDFSGPCWKPSDHPVDNDYEFSTADSRNLGVIVGWDGFLREDCDDDEALLRAARRETRCLEQYENFDPDVHWRRKHHGYDDRWSHLQTLYLRQADFKPVLRIGGEDWRQLGLGWYFLENWEAGPVRWTSRRAEAYLSAKPRHREVYLRVFSGDALLGEQVDGTLKLGYSIDRTTFISFGETPFNLPAGIWTDLKAEFPESLPASGIILIKIFVDQQRSPAKLVPGSSDTRELGLAVAGIAVR
jgi:SAM-dependent methyltransferase